MKMFLVGWLYLCVDTFGVFFGSRRNVFNQNMFTSTPAREVLETAESMRMTMIPVLHAGDHKKEEELGVQDTFKERRSRTEIPSGEWAVIVMG